MHSDVSVRAVIFDMDGVLSDSEPLINSAAVAMFREKGLAVKPEDFVPFVGTGEDRYIGGVAELYGFALDVPAAKRRTYEIYLLLVEQRLESFPGAVSLVHRCRQAGLRTAVASSADLVKIEANLRKIGLPMSDWDAIVSAEDVINKKPAPDIFVAAAQKLSVPTEQCVVIEDAVNGVQAAKAAGMRCVAVAHTFSPARLQAAGADWVKPTIADVSLLELTGPNFEEQIRRAIPTEITPTMETPTINSSSTEPFWAAVSPTLPRAGRWGFWETAGLSLAIFAAFVGVQGAVAVVLAFTHAALGKPVTADILNSGLMWALATLAAAPVMVALCWLFAWLRKGLPVGEYLGLRGVRGRILFRWCIGLVILVLFMDGITALLGRPVVPDVLVHAYRTAGFVPLLWLAVIVIAPISEEIFFRGFMFEGFQASKLGSTGTILLTSLIWAAIHLQYDLFGVILILVAGIVFGYARVKTGSVYATMLMHSIMNLIATIETAIKAQ